MCAAINGDNEQLAQFPMETTILDSEQNREFEKSAKFKIYFAKNRKKFGKMEVDSIELTTFNGNIYVPNRIRESILNWYHHFLCHPGSSRIAATIGNVMAWPGLQADAINFTRTCKTCQKQKKTKVKYGHLPPKIAEGIPWQVLCVDLIGPYTVTIEKNVERTLHAMTFIDPATGWVEIVEINDKTSAHMSVLLDRVWLSRYPRPYKIIFDNGTEFKKDFKYIFKDYGIRRKPTTIKNPQANSILERVHQVVANMLRCKNIPDLTVNTEDPWTDILSSVAFAIRSTHHSTLDATPAQLIYGRDMILPIQHVAEWEYIRTRKQKTIDKANVRENKSRVDYDYSIHDKILITNKDIQRKLDSPTKGPFLVEKVHTNGTVSIKRGAVIERINIRNIKPYFDK